MRPVIFTVIKFFRVENLWYYIDPSNAEDWHQMGRTYMVGHSYQKAYESYQQALYRDAQNPVYWNNVGQLYFKVNQYRDALDVYCKSVRINPYGSETWAYLGELYFNCTNQVQDSLDAYSRALELDPTNHVARARVRQLKIRLQVHQVPLEDFQGRTIDDEISDDISSYRRSVSIIFYMKTLDY